MIVFLLKAKSVFIYFINYILNIIIPRCCLFCGQELLDNNDKEFFICKKCEDDLFCINQKKCCKKCGYPLNLDTRVNFLDKNHTLCYSCKSSKNSFFISRSCFQYKTNIRHLLMNFKFFFKTESISFIGKSLLKTYYFMPDADIICCVPITRNKLFLNGYNHASLIASSFYKELKKNDKHAKILFLPDLLLKTNKSLQSKMLSKQERLAKIHNFIVNDKYLSEKWKQFFYKKTILIVDDIMTTGSTLNSASYTLNKAFKNTKVECLTLARTMLY